MVSSTRINEAANELARLMKGANDFEPGNFAHFFESEITDNDDVWYFVCDLSEEILPSVVVTDEEARSWAEADRFVSAEGAAERKAFGY